MDKKCAQIPQITNASCRNVTSALCGTCSALAGAETVGDFTGVSLFPLNAGSSARVFFIHSNGSKLETVGLVTGLLSGTEGLGGCELASCGLTSFFCVSSAFSVCLNISKNSLESLPFVITYSLHS